MTHGWKTIFFLAAAAGVAGWLIAAPSVHTPRSQPDAQLCGGVICAAHETCCINPCTGIPQCFPVNNQKRCPPDCPG